MHAPITPPILWGSSVLLVYLGDGPDGEVSAPFFFCFYSAQAEFTKAWSGHYQALTGAGRRCIANVCSLIGLERPLGSTLL